MAKPKATPTAAATPSRPRAASAQTPKPERGAVIIEDSQLIFGRGTFVWVGIGIALMLLGMALMAGGAMPSPDVWDEELIYSFRRITLAPIVILAGLGVVTYAILKK